MHHRLLVTVAVGAVLMLGACSSAGATSPPASEPSVAPPVEASPAPTPEATASEAVASTACSESDAAGEVSVEIEDFVFNPADIQAKVGQTVTFTNKDTAPHNAALDDRSCVTPNLLKGRSAGLTFSASGTYPFHCSVHPGMKGRITVS